MLLFDFANPYLIYFAYLLLTLATIHVLIRHHGFFKRHQKGILMFVTVTMIYSQFVRYGVSAIRGTFTVSESLPFQVCRISSFFMILYLLTRNSKLHGILFFIGGTSIIGVIVPSGPIDNISTLNETYFIDHYLMAVFPFFLLKVDGYQPDVRQATWFAAIIMLIILAFVPINPLLGSDYFHLESQSIAAQIVPGMSTLLFGVLQGLAAYLLMIIYGLMGMRIAVDTKSETSLEQVH